MNRIATIICPLLLRTTIKRSDPLLKFKYCSRSSSAVRSLKLTPSTHRTCATHSHHQSQKQHNDRLAQDGPIIRAYQVLIQRGEYRLDPTQLYTLQMLQALADDIHTYAQNQNQNNAEESSSGWWSLVEGKILPNLDNEELTLPNAAMVQSDEGSATEPIAPRGLYIWGGVGCGKTMLMDLFMQHVHEVNKTRVHFNSFMQSVHQQIHQYRMQQEVVKDDPLDYVVQQIRTQTQLLCFDEFQVTNIADAMLLGRLFDKLWQRQVIVVATSNRPPDGKSSR